jgi:hypothetical protein
MVRLAFATDRMFSNEITNRSKRLVNQAVAATAGLSLRPFIERRVSRVDESVADDRYLLHNGPQGLDDYLSQRRDLTGHQPNSRRRPQPYRRVLHSRHAAQSSPRPAAQPRLVAQCLSVRGCCSMPARQGSPGRRLPFDVKSKCRASATHGSSRLGTSAQQPAGVRQLPPDAHADGGAGRSASAAGGSYHTGRAPPQRGASRSRPGRRGSR